METFIQIAASIAGLLMAIAKFNEVMKDPQKELMEHFKVREKLSADSQHYQNVTHKIDRLLSRLYPDPKAEIEEVKSGKLPKVDRDWKSVKSLLFTSLISFVLFSWWTLWLLVSNLSLWVVFPAVMAFSSYALLKVSIQTCFEEIDSIKVT
ncbi:hypothetical protein TUMSATVNIG1_02240 [Vibrio nigripulchritudo]|uniref:hypothetical protein n=1 Tax=Vibrio nigripulchritudo TaxID=28173 RepID=UPI00190AAE62|nr:hypothetical protein [Vibrio nigripulchritudo]BCL68287.1 hypothetical protein VNTUMSATTG_02240 [Vibrio nigripulchritudo]BDU29615.1 hypothetical protein TUMSATVNIG1_02240 [Vibrio nigripulchritudo]